MSTESNRLRIFRGLWCPIEIDSSVDDEGDLHLIIDTDFVTRSEAIKMCKHLQRAFAISNSELENGS